MKMLIVDDEYYAVKGISEGIDWSDFPFDSILEAVNVEDAKQILKDKKIDILISDIEMPGKNGLDLLEWIKKESPATETIFLTGHANFDYAQQAVRLGSFDYVLKPVDHDHLKQIVLEAVKKIDEERQLQDFNETYKIYYEQWKNQLPLLVERFWLDLLSERIPSYPERLKSAFDLYDIPLTPESGVVPILLSVEQWAADLSTRDEEIMEYALRKAASEIILKEEEGAVISDPAGYNLIIRYGQDTVADREELRRRCREFVQACSKYFHCNLSCYIGQTVMAAGIMDAVRELLEIERSSVMGSGRVVSREQVKEKDAKPADLLPVSDIKVLIEAGKKAEAEIKISQSLEQMRQKGVQIETMEYFYYGLSSILYEVCLKKNLYVGKLFPDRDLQNMAAATRSLNQLNYWALRVTDKVMDAMNQNHKNMSSVITTVQEYISGHLAEELGREHLAAAVYLNPAYLSRLFKKETGISLSEYIAQERMEKAKRLLAEGNIKISGAAELTGYTHFSHFSKMFKKYTGMTPHEYRKKFGAVED